MQLDHYIRACAARDQVRPEAVRFTQRELRERLHWQDRALRRQLRRLVQLEFVVALPHGSAWKAELRFTVPNASASSPGAPLSLNTSDGGVQRARRSYRGGLRLTLFLRRIRDVSFPHLPVRPR